MASRSIDILQISAPAGQDGNVLLVQGNAFATARLDTSNVAETGNNLYFSNDRAFAAVANTDIQLGNVTVTGNLDVQGAIVGLDTDDVAEGSNNFYFNNTRTIAALTAGTGISIESNGLISANSAGIAFTGTTDDVPEGANLYFTNARAIAAVEDNLTTDNIAEGSVNLYWSDSRVNTALANSYTIVTGNVLPTAAFTYDLGSEQYPWRDLWLSGFTLRLGNIILRDTAGKFSITTSNANAGPAFTTIDVPEGEANGNANLYFTNTRAYAAVANTDITFSNLTVTGLFSTAGVGGSLTGANLVSAAYINGGRYENLYSDNVIERGNLFYTNARVESFINDSISTSNIAEGANLYFTNTRAIGSLTAGENITIEANGLIIATQSSNAQILAAIDGQLTTDNVTEGSNLYFTNTRAIGSLTAGENIVIEANGLIIGSVSSFAGNTDIIPEGTANLYFTNTRAYAAVANTDISFGNVTAGNLTVTGQFNTTGVGGSLTGANLISANYINAGQYENLYSDNVIERGNLFFSNSRAISAFTAGDNIAIEANGLIVGATQAFTGNTDIVPEGTSNLYYTNARVEAYINDSVTTSNIVEGSNLYYTNARVEAYINDSVTTDNVTEGSNLYFTNARAQAAVANTNISFGNVTAGNLTVTGQFNTTGVGGSLTGANLISAAYINAGQYENLYSDNVIERGNLFFTNTRAVGALTGGDNIVIEANGLIIGAVQAFTGNTDAVPEGVSNLYYTNARVDAYIASNIRTSDIAEDGDTSNGNVYFTNTRARQAFTAGTNVVIDANGLISITGVTASPTFTDLTVDGDLTVQGNLFLLGNATQISANTLQIDDPIVHFAANNEISDTVDFGWLGHYSPDSGVTKSHAGMFRDSDNGQFYIFGSYVDENLDSGNLVTNIDRTNASFSLAIVHANAFVGNLQGQISDISNFTTSNLVEGSNLYFTNARAIGSLTGGEGITIEANGLVVSSGSASTFTGNTDGVVEGTSNLYFTNARAVAAVTDNINTSNVIEGANLYFTNARAVAALQDNINTSNVAEGANLYFTNARAVAAVEDNINTSNVIEGANLYFTNTRAIGALTGGDRITIEANGLIVADDQGFTGNTDSVAEGVANLYFTNARVEAYISDSITTSNIVEGSNLYFTNARAVAAVEDNINTSNVVEGANLYFTNARALAAVVDTITTDNVIEGANLFFTNTRAIGSLTGGDGITIEANGLIISSGSASTFTGNTDGVTEGVNNLYYTNARVEAFIADSITTDNVTEGSNLYFTNTRAIGALTGGDRITIEANGLIIADDQGFSGNTDAVPEGVSNLYYTNARVLAVLEDGVGNIIPSGNTKDLGEETNVWNTLYVSNIELSGTISTAAVGTPTLESDTNLNLSANDAVVITKSPLQLASKDTANVANIVASNGMIIFNTTEGKLQAYYNNNWRDLGEFTGNTDIVPEGSNLYFTNARAIGSLTAGEGITIEANGLVVGSGTYTDANALAAVKDNINTSNILEGSNLYFTNVRAIEAVELAVTKLDVSAPGLYYSIDQYPGTNPDIYVTAGETIAFDLSVSGHPFLILVSAGGASYDTGLIHVDDDGTISTASGAQGKTSGVLYWKVPYSLRGNTYAYQCQVHGSMVGNIIIGDPAGLSSLTTSNVAEGSNLYFTNARAVGSLTGGSGVVIEANGLIIVDTSNISVTASNVFANDIQVSGNVISNGLIINGFEVLSSTSAGDIKANTITANVWVGLYTDNVIEGSNLYFTNSRAVGAFTAGNSIVLESNGYIDVNAAYLTYTSSQTFTGDAANTIFTLGSAVTREDTIVVSINGAVKVPVTDYTVSGNQLEFVAAPSNGAVIEVRFLNVQTSSALEYYGRSYTGNGVQTVFAIGPGLAANSILVFENGVAQSPTVDYSVIGANVVFAVPPGANTNVHIRELPILNYGNLITYSGNTDNIVEGSNLYFTNARAVGALTAGQNIVIESNGLVIGTVSGPTSDVEFRDVTVNGNLNVLGNTTTFSVTQLEIFDPIVKLAANNEIADTIDFGWMGHYSPDSGVTRQHAGMIRKHGTDDFYIFHEYIDDELDSGNLVTNVDTANNTFKLATVHANVFQGNLLGQIVGGTDSVPEGSNLYFTNARAIAAFTPGNQIDINANGLISTNVSTSLVISDSSTYTGDGVTTQYALVQNAESNTQIIVVVDGLVARPNVDYGVSGNVDLEFTSAPADGSNIEVRYFGTTFATPASTRSIVRRAMVTAILFG